MLQGDTTQHEDSRRAPKRSAARYVAGHDTETPALWSVGNRYAGVQTPRQDSRHLHCTRRRGARFEWSHVG